MLVKIQNDSERAERVQLEKSALLEQRKQIQTQMRAEKEELMKKFDVIQKTGKIPPELMEKIGKDRLDSLNNTKNDGATEDYKDSTIKKPVKEPKKDAFKPKPQIKRIEPKKEVVPEKSLSNVDQQNASLKKQSEK